MPVKKMSHKRKYLPVIRVLAVMILCEEDDTVYRNISFFRHLFQRCKSRLREAQFAASHQTEFYLLLIIFYIVWMMQAYRAHIPKMAFSSVIIITKL